MKQKLLFGFLFCFLFGFQVFAQERAVTGKVTDPDTGEGIPGVSVVVKGTNVGVVTDVTGTYTINVPEGATLVFQAVGYGTREVAVGAQSTVDMAMLFSTKELGEVVVTALGIEKDSRNLGYSITQVTNKDLTTARSTNLINGLQAKVAGVRVVGGNGSVGASSQIFIRGFTSLNGTNQPLFVVDGIPIDNSGGGNALQTGVNNSNRTIDLNQDDIETMSILKGPAAAALYGSRASAGAILITTKKGKRSQKNAVSFTSVYNVYEVNRFPDYQNEYAQGTGGAFTQAPGPGGSAGNFSWGPRMTGQRVRNFLTPQDTLLLGVSGFSILNPRPDNVKDMFQRGQNIQNTVSFSGGSDKSTFFVSYGNLVETGYFDNNKLTRNNFTANISHQVTEKLNVGINAQYINTRTKRTPQGNQLANPLFRLWMTPRSFDYFEIPYIRPTDFSQVHWDAVDQPLFAINNIKYEDRVDRFVGNINLNYDITKWLSISYRLGADVFSETYEAIDPQSTRGAAFWNNSAARTAVAGQSGQAGRQGAIGNGQQLASQVSSFFNILIKKDINENFAVNAILGNEINAQRRENQTSWGNNIAVPGFDNVSNTSSFQVTNNLQENRLIGFYGQVELTYKKWATLGFTGRYDLSSTFPTDQQGYFYPAVTGNAIITDAIPSLKSDILTFLKLRANYTRVGRPSPFLYVTDTYLNQANPNDGFGPQIQFPFRGRTGFTLSNTAGNTLLGPEFVTNIEFGTEFKLFKDLIRVDVNYFDSKTVDAILSVPQSQASGFGASVQNAGKLSSKGWEVLIGGAIKLGEFNWDISINWARIRNTVDELAPGVPQVILAGFTRPNTQLAAGKPYGLFFGSVFNREPTTGKLLVDANGLPSLAPTNGFLGDPNPNWTGGINSVMSYKGISLTLVFDVRNGGDGFFRTLSDLYRTGVTEESASKPRFEADGVTPAKNWVIDGVFADGTPNNINITAEQYWNGLYGFGRDEFAVQKINWFRLREAAITYNLPKSLLNKTFLGNVEIGLNGRNLFLITNVPHIDPEISANIGAGNAIGFESNNPPPARSYGAFIKVTF